MRGEASAATGRSRDKESLIEFTGDKERLVWQLVMMRIPALDGLRAASILLVLAAHLLPLGPKSLALNEAAGLMGMALFFALSGFLIVHFLATGMAVWSFVIRRIARIVPLAWAAMSALYIAFGGDIISNIGFYSNIPPTSLLEGGGHLWSLCVEMQFYAFVTLLALSPSRRSLMALPFISVFVTILRIVDGVPYSIVTWYRIDEIMAGGTIALIYVGWLGSMPEKILKRIPFLASIILLTASCTLDFMQYIRPYAGALVLGSSIYNLGPRAEKILVNRSSRYIAETSYALYVFHGMMIPTWLGSGETLVKYMKRPLLIMATFVFAHISTFYFEKPINRIARHLDQRMAGSGLR